MSKEKYNYKSMLSDQWYYLSESPNSLQLATINEVSRAFQYGDGIFESIRIQANKAPLFNPHWNRLKNSASHFNYDIIENLWKKWEGIISLIIEKNLGSFRLKIILTRESGGLFTPEDPNFILLIRLSPISLISKINIPLKIAVQKSVCSLEPSISNHKTCNSLPYIMAGLEAKARNLDSIILRCKKDEVIECHAYNIFFRKGNKIFTPWLKSGCLNGVTRAWVIKNLENSSDYKLLIQVVKVSDIPGVDEVFITNAIHGIIGISQMDELESSKHFLADDLQGKWSQLFA